jgi:plasmid replication initiation protein
MITNTTTPRTDAEQKWTFGDNRPGMSFECVKVEFAQELERELNKADTLWRYQKEETDKRIAQIRKLQKAFDDACAANKTYRQQEMKHSPEHLTALLQHCEDRLAEATLALQAAFAATDPYADGAPDASAHDRLCNEIATLARPWAAVRWPENAPHQATASETHG